MKNLNAEKYNIIISKINDSDKVLFKAAVIEFPDLNDYADSFHEAYALIIDSINTTIEIFNEKNQKIPDPITN